MKVYLTRVLAILATALSAQASLDNRARAQDSSERQAWSSALTDGSIDAFKEYLAKYPIGAFSREAFARIIQLSPEPEIFSEFDRTRSSVEGGGRAPAQQERLSILERRLNDQY